MSAGPAETSNERGLRRGAPLPRFPCIREGQLHRSNVRKGRRKQVAAARLRLRALVERVGIKRIAVLTVTTADECRSSADFQRRWHSFRTHVLSRWLTPGVWMRERQPRTGNWHAHALVDAGFDIQTEFPFEDVSRNNYRSVRREVRSLWKRLREEALRYGFGRTQLLPIDERRGGADAVVGYLTRYLSKSFSSEKLSGEEKGRLLGMWGLRGMDLLYPDYGAISPLRNGSKK
jgi:hypothetical protein